MFDFVRTHSRLAQGLLVLLIFPSFVFFGIQGYSRFTDAGNATVAKVDGQSITRAEWDQAHQRAVDGLRRQMPTADPKLFETPEARRETLEQLIRQRVLAAAANDQHLYPEAERLRRLFDSDPSLAAFRGPDGRINRDLLIAQGMTPAMFDAQLRQQFGLQQVLNGVADSGFTPPAVANISLDALLQRREIQFQRFEPATYAAKVNPTDAEIEAFFKAHEADFRAPEQASIDYVVLSLDTVAKSVTVTDDQLKQFYNDNAARFTVPEERRASHILIKAEPDKKAARAKAEELLAQVRKNPASFADVAKKNSQDPGSAERGGDLDFFGRGMMTPAFEQAAFALKSGEISDVVESDFGFHIITVTAVRGGTKKPFEEARAEIESEVRKSAAKQEFAKASEQFSDIVYQQPDSLQPVIDKLKLDKQTATVQRTPAPGATGVLASPKLLEAVFSTDSVKNKRNTDAIETGPSQYVAARIVDYKPARTLPLADVKAQVRERVVATQAAAQARQDGEKRLAEAQKAPADALPTSATVSRRVSAGLPREMLEAALKADAAKLPAVVGVDLGDKGYAVIRVVQVMPREAGEAAEAGAMLKQVSQGWTRAEAAAYMESLKRRYKAEVKELVVSAAVAASAAAP